MIFIGDVHGKISQYLNIINKYSDICSIQVGDFGVGFVDIPWIEIDCRHKFIRGNHDNPDMSREIPNYLGDYGYYNNIFYVSGAISIDRNYRIEGVDWWRDEELSYLEMSNMIELYRKFCPRIVVSHEAPTEVVSYLKYNSHNNPTSSALQMIFEYNRPEIWIFGHHHLSFRKKINKTLFIGLDELEVYKIGD